MFMEAIMVWVTVANTNNCKIFNYNKKNSELTIHKEISHPELKKNARDNITTERPGSYMSKDSAHGAYEPHFDAKEIEVIKFAEEISNELEHGRNNNLYKELIVISLPHMDGLLMQHLNKHVKKLIIEKIHKDIIKMDNTEIIKFLKNRK